MRLMLMPILMLCYLMLPPLARADDFKLLSTNVTDGQFAPPEMVNDDFGCRGQNHVPPLTWAYPPVGTGSYALTMYDPEASWMHWIVLDIPAATSALAVEAGYKNDKGLPDGAYSLPNSYGRNGYSGPCPSDGQQHHYIFTIYAMPDQKTDYAPGSALSSANDWLEEKSLGKATLSVVYQRP